MKKIKSYTAKKYKIWRRIAFFAVVAVIILILTVVLGNVLKKRLENTDISTDDIPLLTEPDETDPADDPAPSVAHDESLKSVSAGCLDLAGVTEPDDARAAVDALRADGYNSLSFVVRDSDGMVTYASPALQTYSGIKASETLVSFDMLRTAVVYAKDRGMKCSAVFGNADAQHDPLIAAELAEVGFNDMLLRAYEDLERLDNSAVADINTYVSALRGAGNAAFGISLSREIYTAAQNAPYIETLYKSCEYFAIDMSSVTADEASDICSSLQGSFSMYMMRCVVHGNDADRAAKIKAQLSEHNISSVQYISAPPKPQNDEDNNAAQQ